MCGLLTGATLASLIFTTPALAGDDWSSLDEELAALAAAAQTEPSGGPRFSGWVTSLYAGSGDPTDPVLLASGDDLGGFFLDSVRLNVEGNVGDYGYRFSYDFFSPAPDVSRIFDAYATVPIPGDVMATIGQFRTPFLRTALFDENHNLFLTPTRNALFYRVRDLSKRGVMLSWENERFGAQLAVQNGLDIFGDNLLVTLRGTAVLVGEELGGVEGAYGAPEQTTVMVGAAYSDDGSGRDGTALAAEVALNRGGLYLQVESVSYDDDYTLADLASGVITDPRAGRGDTNPISVTASHLLGSSWEVATRYDAFDDQLTRELFTVGVNHYFMGHDAKALLNFSTESSRDADADIIAVGLSLSF